MSDSGVTEPRRLRAFLCHCSEDKPRVRELYKKLWADNIKPWLDEKDILPGTDWDVAIRNAVRESDVVMVCLSSTAVNKEGYVQKELKGILGVADEKPEGTIFVIPVKFEECRTPESLRHLQCVTYGDEGYDGLKRALQVRARSLGLAPVPLASFSFGIQGDGDGRLAKYELSRRVLGEENYKYQITMTEVDILMNGVKFNLCVTRHGIGVPPHLVCSEGRGVGVGSSIDIPNTDWELKLIETSQNEATFVLFQRG
jgi:hypothetical protein